MTLPLAAHAPPLRQDHGALRVGRSNVTLESVLWAFKQGATPEQIVDQFPTITLADAYEVVGYYLRNRAQVDVYLSGQERAHTEQALEIRRAFPSRMTRADLEGRGRQ